MTQRIIIVGPPGTGKTTSLISLFNYLTGSQDNEVMDFVRKYSINNLITKTDYTGDDIVFITFTTSAARVLRERGIENAYTMHSYITRVLIQNKILNPSKLYNGAFVSAMMELGYGYDFRDRYSNHPSNVAEMKYSYYFNVYYDKNTEKILQIIEEKEDVRVYERIKAYVDWKKRNNVFDYVSVLRYFLAVPVQTLRPAKEAGEPWVLILDEAQDFSPLQWAVVRKVEKMGSFDYIIAAGDPNQSIYGFQGANPADFEDFRKGGATIVLNQSYRLPRRVQKKAEMLTKWLGTAWKYAPREEEGRVKVFTVNKKQLRAMDKAVGDKVVELVNQSAEKGKTVFVLLRTNKQVRELEKYIIAAGYSVSRIKNDYSLSDLLDEVLEFEEEKKVGELLYYAVTSLDETGVLLRNKLKNNVTVNSTLKDAYIRSTLEDYFRTGNIDMKILDEGTFLDLAEYFEKHYLDVLDTEEKLIYEAMMENHNGKTVFVDTLHASKGEEADVVIVIDFVNARIEKEVQKDNEALREEIRTLYVGMTRAKEELYVITSNSKRSILQYARF